MKLVRGIKALPILTLSPTCNYQNFQLLNEEQKRTHGQKCANLLKLLAKKAELANRDMEKKSMPAAKNILGPPISQKKSNKSKPIQQQNAQKRKCTNDDDESDKVRLIKKDKII